MDKILLTSQLETVTSLRNHEHQTWLNIFFASFTTNSLLIVALFTGSNQKFVDSLVIGILGIVLTLQLARIQNRAFLSMRVYEELSKRIEAELFNTVIMRVFSYNFFRRKFTKPLANDDLTDTFQDLTARERDKVFRDLLRAHNKGTARTMIGNARNFIVMMWLFIMIYFYLRYQIKPSWLN